MIAIFLLACTAHDTDPHETGGGADTLTIPDYASVDLESVFAQALGVALATDARPAWAGHRAALDLGTASCPSVYFGTPDLQNNEFPNDERGLSWADHCSADGDDWGGVIWWSTALSTIGDASTSAGATTTGERQLIGTGTVARGDEVLFEFDGASDDAISLETAPDYTHWSYSSQMDATVTGTLPFPDGDALSGGWRSNVYQRYAGGDVQTLEVRGNVYLFDARIAEKFDSVSVDLNWTGPDGATADACTAEPQGVLSVRDDDADWYDLVFEPLVTDTGSTYTDTGYTKCDGCGRLYVRGVDQGVTVCPDLSSTWDPGFLEPPPPADFAPSSRETLPE